MNKENPILKRSKRIKYVAKENPMMIATSKISIKVYGPGTRLMSRIIIIGLNAGSTVL